MVLDEKGNSVSDRQAIATPDPATPKAVMNVICTSASKQGSFDRVLLGFPRVVEEGITKSAANLDFL